MLTDYVVHCPYEDCGWRGCLFPLGRHESWSPAAPMHREICFECPTCRRQWQARIVGDDAVPLPLEAITAEV